MAFKGGASLSKVYGVIDRFSEDVDITLDCRAFAEGFDPFAPGFSRSAIRRFGDRLKSRVESYARDVVRPALEATADGLPAPGRPAVRTGVDGRRTPALRRHVHRFHRSARIRPIPSGRRNRPWSFRPSSLDHVSHEPEPAGHELFHLVMQDQRRVDVPPSTDVRRQQCTPVRSFARIRHLDQRAIGPVPGLREI